MSQVTLNDLALESLARSIARYLQPDALWDAVDAADYLRCDPRQVVDRYSKLPSFPKAIRLPTETGGRGHPKWQSAKVKAWALKHEGSAGAGRPRKA